MKNNTKATLNPWVTMWTKPRQTTHQILNKDSEHKVLVLAAIIGIDNILNMAVSHNVGDKEKSFQMIILASIIVGTITGILSLYLVSKLINFTGKILGGQGSFNDIKKALAWANIPVIWGMVLWIPKMILFGQDLFMSKSSIICRSEIFSLLDHFFITIEVIIGIWGAIVLLKCLSEVQKFSVWKALLNVLLMLLIVIPMAMLITKSFLTIF